MTALNRDVVPLENVSERLAQQNDARLPGALNSERKLWEELDRSRIAIMENALRPYTAAVRARRPGGIWPLISDHELRLECAAEHLKVNPLR